MADPIAAPAGPAVVVNPRGQVVQIAAADLDNAIAQGYRLPTSAESQALAERAQLSTPGAAAQTFGEAAARALTFGGSDVLHRGIAEFSGMSPEEVEAEMAKSRALAETNPTANTLGTIAGIAAPLLLTGGASAPASAGAAAATGAKAAGGALRALAELAPPSLVAKAGRVITEAVEGVLPEATSLAGRIAERALAVGAGSAVEGAAYGAGQVVSEAALGDPNLTAQSALATVGLSAALGGGLGSAFGAAEVGVPAVIHKAGDAVAGAVAKFKKAYPEIAEKLTSGRITADQVREGMAKYDAAFKDPKQVLRLQQDLGDSLEKVANNVAEAQRSLYSEARPAEIAEQIRSQSPWNLKPLSSAQGALDSLRGAAKTIRAQPDLYEQGFAAKLEDIANGVERRIADGDAVQVFEELRTARQQVDQFAKYGPKALSALPFKEREAVQIVRGVRGAIRDVLHDEEAWGPTAVRQASLDELHSDYAQALKALTGGGLSPLRSNLLRKVVQGGAEELQLNPRALRTMLAQMGDSRAGQVVAAIDDYLGAADRFARGMEESFHHAPAANFDRAALTDLVERTGKLTDQAQLQAEATRFLNDLNPAAQFSGSGVRALLPQASNAGAVKGLATLGAAPLLGAVIPGAAPVAAVYGAAKAGYHLYEGLKNVPQMVATLAHLERMTQKVTQAIDVAASTLVRGSSKAANIGRAETLAGIAKEFGGSTESATALFNRRVAEIQNYSQNPEALHRAIVGQNRGIEDHAPNTAQALAVSSARAVSFLASKVPQHPPSGPLAAQWTPSRSEMSKFARYYEAVQNPMVILRQAAAGTLTSQSVEAVQAVYPELFAKIRGSLVEKITAHGNRVPAASRLALSVLLGQDMDGRIGMLAKNQATHAGPSQKKADVVRPTAGGMGGLKVSNRAMTPQQSSAERRG